MSRRVTESLSTATATNLGTVATCIDPVAGHQVRARPGRLPTTNSPVGNDQSTRRRSRSYSSGSRPGGMGPMAPAWLDRRVDHWSVPEGVVTGVTGRWWSRWTGCAR